MPRPFHEVARTLDSRVDSFLRQYTAGDLALLRSEGIALRAQGMDEAPSGADNCSRLNAKCLG